MQVPGSQTWDMKKEEEDQPCPFQVSFSNRMFWDLYFCFIQWNFNFNSPRYVSSTIRHQHNNEHKWFCRLIENEASSGNNFELNTLQKFEVCIRNNSHLPLLLRRRKQILPFPSRECILQALCNACVHESSGLPAKSGTFHLTTIHRAILSTNTSALFQFHLYCGLRSWYGKTGQQLHDIWVSIALCYI